MATDRFPRLDDTALNQLFLEARTQNGFRPEPVPLNLLHEIYNLARMGPTSANACPARFAFVVSPEAKARLLKVMAPGNVEKTRSAPVTAIIAYDSEFYEQLPRLFPHADMKRMFAGNPQLAAETAMRNGSLQGAYFILAARSLGLDCGPMSGFDAEKLNAEFFPGGKWRVNFLCNLGKGETAKLYPRGPRLEFDEACRVL